MSRISKDVEQAIAATDEQFVAGDTEQCQILLDELADVDLAMQSPDLTEDEKDRLVLRRLALGRLYHAKRCDAPQPANA